MARKPTLKAGSGCPVGVSREISRDCWLLLLILRMTVRGDRTFREFQHAGAGVAINVIGARIHKPKADGSISLRNGRLVPSRELEPGISFTRISRFKLVC